MIQECPQCRQPVHELARYCARCGSRLEATAEDRSPQGNRDTLLTAPPGFLPCEGSKDLYCKWESGWGGTKLLSTETQVVLLFNAGVVMTDVNLEIVALNSKGEPIATLRPSVAQLPRGETVRLDVPSYELPDEVHTLTVAVERHQPAAHER